MDRAALRNRLEQFQAHNRTRLFDMLLNLVPLALLATLLLGLYQVLRLEPSRKRMRRA